VTTIPQHHSWLVSPYSAKTRSYLTYKGIDFEDRVPSIFALAWTIRRAVGRPIMPTVCLPNGTWLQDSSAIIDHFEREPSGPSIVPEGPTQRLASTLIDLFADEWLPMAALHYRWSVPQNKRFALDEFARCALPWMPRRLALRSIRPMAARMQSYLPVLGVTPATVAAVEQTTMLTIQAAEATLVNHPYLFGTRPCLADFSLFGPLWSHLYRDPGTTHLFDDAPSVVAWMERLRTGNHPKPGAFLADDAVPDGLAPLFACIVEDQLPWAHTLVQRIDGWCAEHPDAGRVPRSLGRAPFQIRGVAGERVLVTSVQWKAQRARQAYEQAEGAADDWLIQIGCPNPQQAIPAIHNPMVMREFKPILANR
jgi:glutathione S-transferase